LLEPSKSAAASFTNDTDSDDLPLRRISISTAFARCGVAGDVTRLRLNRHYRKSGARLYARSICATSLPLVRTILLSL